jgi:hypothetical protein
MATMFLFKSFLQRPGIETQEIVRSHEMNAISIYMYIGRLFCLPFYDEQVIPRIFQPWAEIASGDRSEDGAGERAFACHGPFGKALEPRATQYAHGHDQLVFWAKGIYVRG